MKVQMRRAVLLGLLGLCAGCPAAPGEGASCGTEGPCGADGAPGRCSLAGRCVYPVPVTVCAAGLRYASGACVLTEAPARCACSDDGNPCTQELCADGQCVHPNDYNGNFCPGGLCYEGACCAGCWDGARCHAGTAVSACGSHGGRCEACPPAGAPPDPCRAYSCPGACQGEPINGPGCPHCGSTDELCCAEKKCDAGLACVPVGCGEDCAMPRCRPR